MIHGLFRPGKKNIAHFGAARLVRNFDGLHELIGGTPAEQSVAREWYSLFAPEIIFTPAPRPSHAQALAA